MDTIQRGNGSEALCTIVIDTLKDLRWRSRPITPSVLHQALAGKQEYIEFLAGAGLADFSFGNSCQSAEMVEKKQQVQTENDPSPYMETLRDFRLNLLGEFEDKAPRDFLALASGIRERLTKSNKVKQVLDINDEVLLIIRAAKRRVSEELDQFTTLVREIGKDLVEIDTGLVSSISCSRETYESNKAFNNTLAYDLEDTTETIHKCANLIEIRGFVAAKLATIKESIKKKREQDEHRLKRATEELKRLRQQVAGMKREIVYVQKRAKDLEEETLLDPLTGVHNRRAYEKRLLEEMENFRRSGEIFSILMIDIDQFKSINDCYGHWAGDRCLEELTKLINKILRGTDFLARYGGEEFITILSGTDQRGVRIVAERLRKLIERARFIYQNEEIPLTVSIGGTTIDASDQDIETIFKRVDTAMYEAKKKGRNRSVVL